MWGECQNFVATEPAFNSREECRRFADTIVPKIQKVLPESSGSTYCFDEQEVMDITNRMLQEYRQNLDDLLNNI
jgi:hypothetical protein